MWLQYLFVNQEKAYHCTCIMIKGVTSNTHSEHIYQT